MNHFTYRLDETRSMKSCTVTSWQRRRYGIIMDQCNHVRWHHGRGEGTVSSWINEIMYDDIVAEEKVLYHHGLMKSCTMTSIIIDQWNLDWDEGTQSQNNLNHHMKTKLVTAGANATVYVRHVFTYIQPRNHCIGSNCDRLGFMRRFW